jgi:UPF0755 protein
MIRRLLLLVIALGVTGAAFLYWAVLVPHGGRGEPVFVVIEPGTPTRSMARTLARSGVIRFDWSFLIARALNPDARLQAGEYRFERPASTWQVFNKIARGDIFYYELRVPEGANMFDIAGQLEQMGLMKSEVFLNAARNTSLIADIASSAPTLEGYLFPSTYRVARHTTAQQITREMTNHFRKVWKELGGPSEGVNHAVTLASLVEKETGVTQERPAVASVYHNRIRLGMKLDCDPTTIYAALLEGRYRGTIYRSDLDNDHPYNTYRHPGLPPGPIANPGRESLKAALHPANTAYLYFVAKGDGSGAHVFSESLSQHNAAVGQYRQSTSH